MNGHWRIANGRRRRSAAGRCIRAGAALVETAIILPLLITLFLACVDFGRYAYTYITLTNAVRAGGAVACRAPADVNLALHVRQAILDEFFGQAQVDPERLVIATPVRSTDPVTGYRRVRVAATYRFTTIINWPLLPHEVDLAAAVEMRVIR
jgi:Flp pilus assembly protein TadG